VREIDRRNLTFEQAEGAAPLPSQLALGEMSKELRSLLWLIVHEIIKDSATFDADGDGNGPWIAGNFEVVLKSYWVLHEFNFSDEFKNSERFWVYKLGSMFKTGSYTEIFGFIQFVMRRDDAPYRFSEGIEQALRRARAAYFVTDNTIMPAATAEDRVAVSSAFESLRSKEYSGARTHLRKAGELLSEGHWSDSVRESIHAVESAVRKISGEGATLSAALAALQKKGRMNVNLKRAMNALYDYTSDEQGVRHALVLNEAEVTESDALYMFSVCAAFLTYSVKTMQADI
jgi:hypothetical protein